MRKLYALIILFSLFFHCVADNFTAKIDAFEAAVKGKFTSFDTKFETKMSTFESSVSGKFSSWEKNFNSKLSNFESSVKGKCDSFSTNLNNKLNSFEKSVREKTGGTNTATKVSNLKADVKKDFSSLSTSMKDEVGRLKSGLKGEFGDTDYAQIENDVNSFVSGFAEDWEDEVDEQIAEEGDLDDALNEVGEEATKLNTVVGNRASYELHCGSWGVQTFEAFVDANGHYQFDITTYHTDNQWVDMIVRVDGLYVEAHRGGYKFMYTFTDNGRVSSYSSWGGPHVDDYGVLSNWVSVGSGVDSDGDGVSDDAETAAGTDPNDPEDYPEPTPEEQQSELESKLNEVAGQGDIEPAFSTGIEAIDLIISKVSPNFSGLIPGGQDDFSLTIPLNFPPYIDFEIYIGNWDSLLDGKIAWLRLIFRGISMIVMTWVCLQAIILSLRQW